MKDDRGPLDMEAESWREFRRSLPRNDQEAFDRVIEKAMKHSGAASESGRENPFELMVMSVMIEMAKERLFRRGEHCKSDDEDETSPDEGSLAHSG
ncbi:MAG: hypothetical protein QCI82_07725 [Candidatus Thermoplasmatota archaeon]|nr:hypothetical protein [Candidatus Thermoplasmatota archaeon]